MIQSHDPTRKQFHVDASHRPVAGRSNMAEGQVPSQTEEVLDGSSGQRIKIALAMLAALSIWPGTVSPVQADDWEVLFDHVQLIGYTSLDISTAPFDVKTGDLIRLQYTCVQDPHEAPPANDPLAVTMRLSTGWSDRIAGAGTREQQISISSDAALTVEGRLDGWDAGDHGEFTVSRLRAPVNLQVIPAQVRADGGFTFGYRNNNHQARPSSHADLELYYSDGTNPLGPPVRVKFGVPLSPNATQTYELSGAEIPPAPAGMTGLMVVVNRTHSAVESDYGDNTIFRPLSGSANLTVSTTQLVFGRLRPRIEKKGNFNIANTGPPWTILTYDVQGPSGWQLKFDSRFGSIGGGKAVTVWFSILGDTKPGPRDGKITIRSSAPNLAPAGDAAISISVEDAPAVPVHFRCVGVMKPGTKEHQQSWSSHIRGWKSFTDPVNWLQYGNAYRKLLVELARHVLIVRYAWDSSSGNINDLRNGVIVEELRYADPHCGIGTGAPRTSPWSDRCASTPPCGINPSPMARGNSGTRRQSASFVDVYGDDENCVSRPSTLAGESLLYQTYWYYPHGLDGSSDPKRIRIARNIIRCEVDPDRGPKDRATGRHLGQVKQTLYSVDDSGRKRQVTSQVGTLYNFDIPQLQ